MQTVGGLAVRSIAIASAAAIVLLFGSSVQAATVKEVFEKYQLIGALASDCGKQVDAKNPYLDNRVIDADHVELDRMVGPTNRESATIVDKAAESKSNELTASASIGDQRYDMVFRVESGRIRVMESTSPNGQTTITGGRATAGNAETPWFRRCLQKVTIHNAPEGGGKCLQPLNGEIKAGVRLTMWDCNDLPPQIFSFDTLNGQLMIGDLCVDTVGGGGQPSIQLPLAACNGAPSQSWKTKVIGNYLELVGINDHCIDISYYAKTNRAAVALWRCHGESNQRWQLEPALDLTYEPNVNREGHTYGELNLTIAEPKLCQMSCIETRQCTACVYRKPEGRTDHHAHCWLLDKTTKTDQDSFVVSGSVRPEPK
jgi:hypothetical protein